MVRMSGRLRKLSLGFGRLSRIIDPLNSPKPVYWTSWRYSGNNKNVSSIEARDTDRFFLEATKIAKILKQQWCGSLMGCHILIISFCPIDMTIPGKVVDRTVYICDVEEVVSPHLLAKRYEQFAVNGVVYDTFICA